MLTEGRLNLTGEEVARIEAHLREQYRGVFDERMIEAHLNEFVESSFADRLAAVIAQNAGANDTVLDIGAGYGAFVLSCRRHGLDAIGYEIASFEVGISRERLLRIDPRADASAVFRNGDAGRLPFSDETFQTVTLLNVLEHVPNYHAVLAEATRVLRPGGRLFIVCPNYAALRKEAHYHVPWLPFFPRRLASTYLRLLGRNPAFFQDYIYYCTNWGVLHAVKALGLQPLSLDLIRLDHTELFGSARIRRILYFVRSAGLAPLVRIVFKANLYNPLKSAVTVVAAKNAAR